MNVLALSARQAASRASERATVDRTMVQASTKRKIERSRDVRNRRSVASPALAGATTHLAYRFRGRHAESHGDQRALYGIGHLIYAAFHEPPPAVTSSCTTIGTLPACVTCFYETLRA